MKFLNVYCEDRKQEVFINLDKIVVITKLDDEKSRIEVSNGEPVVVLMPAEDLIRRINGEDRIGIGFRTNR